jgi:sporulation protein YabP
MVQEEKTKNDHEIRLSKREAFVADGVLYVESFDEKGLSLATVMGELVIEGENLKIEGFSKENGTVRITGMVQGIYYGDETRSKKKLFGRLFQ